MYDVSCLIGRFNLVEKKQNEYNILRKIEFSTSQPIIMSDSFGSWNKNILCFLRKVKPGVFLIHLQRKSLDE